MPRKVQHRLRRRHRRRRRDESSVDQRRGRRRRHDVAEVVDVSREVKVRRRDAGRRRTQQSSGHGQGGVLDCDDLAFAR